MDVGEEGAELYGMRCAGGWHTVDWTVSMQ